MNLDSHKLNYHPCRVCKWMKEETVYPIYVEISLTSACNHRCIFCAPNYYLNYEPVFMDTAVIRKCITSMSRCGVKSIAFSGEGEPLLHKDIVDLIQWAKKLGIDVALTTNGVLFTKEKAKQILPYLSWVKFSVDAANEDTYAKIHRTKKGDFKNLIRNIKDAVKIRNENDYDCVIGTQMLELADNVCETKDLIPMMRDIDVDYLVLKPFSDHKKRLGEKDIEYKGMFKYAPVNDDTDTFKVIDRRNAFCNLNEPKPYNECYGQDFIAHISTLGDVYSCINYLGDKNYEYGNIYKDSFSDIWKNKKHIKPKMDNCRSICRIDNINRYLWELKNPPEHVNFI